MKNKEEKRLVTLMSKWFLSKLMIQAWEDEKNEIFLMDEWVKKKVGRGREVRREMFVIFLLFDHLSLNPSQFGHV